MKHDKQNIVATIQKNMKIMQEEAQNYIDKHHTNLPPLCSARHYLFHSLSKRNTLEAVPSTHRTMQNRVEDNNKQLSPKATVYNIQFRKKSLEYRYSPQQQSQSHSKSLLNSTTLKLKMNGKWRSVKNKATFYRQKSDDKIKTIVMNSQIVGLNHHDKTINYNSFSPKLSKMDSSKKQAEVNQKFQERFRQTKKDSPPTKKPKKKKRQIQVLGQVQKKTIENQLLQSIQSIKKRRLKKQRMAHRNFQVNYNHILNPQSQLILRRRKPKLETFRNKQSLQNSQVVDYFNQYTPWELQKQDNNLSQFIDSADF